MVVGLNPALALTFVRCGAAKRGLPYGRVLRPLWAQVLRSPLCAPGCEQEEGRGGLWCTAAGLEMESRHCPARGQERGYEHSGPSGEYRWPGLLA